MWKRSFVATTVALGDTVDDALAAIGGARPALREEGGGASTSSVGVSALIAPSQAHAGRSASHVVAAQLGVPDLDVPASELVAQLRAPHRATRAAALARAVHEIVLRIDEGTLR